MKTFSYTLVTSSVATRPAQSGREAQADACAAALTLRETLVIEEGPRYCREYTIATDAAGRPCRMDALPVN